MQQVTTASSDGEAAPSVKSTISVPSPIWKRAKEQAARQEKSLVDFAADAVAFYVAHLEEEHRREILAAAKSTRKAS